MKAPELPPQVRERMKKVFNECYRAVQMAEDPDTGRRRWELFKELPDKRVCIICPRIVFSLLINALCTLYNTELS